MSWAPTAFKRTWTLASILPAWRMCAGVLLVTCTQPLPALQGAVQVGCERAKQTPAGVSGLLEAAALGLWDLFRAAPTQKPLSHQTPVSPGCTGNQLELYSCFCGSGGPRGFGESPASHFCTSQTNSRFKEQRRLKSEPLYFAYQKDVLPRNFRKSLLCIIGRSAALFFVQLFIHVFAEH